MENISEDYKLTIMKELSTEQKAKRYDEAKYIMKEYLESGNAGVIAENTIRKAFPELAESEDEKIRKALMQNLKERFGTKGNMGEGLDMPDVLAWLEKQGQVKESIISQHENKICKESDDSLTSKNEKIKKSLAAYFTKFKPDDMWDADFSFGDIVAWLEKQCDKTAWSEDDENRINRLIAYFEDKESFTAEDDVVYANWLKSLKDRPQSQKQKWSTEDEARFESCIKVLQTSDGYDTINVKWLKSLKYRYTWKPSEEQMGVIEAVINNRSFQRRHLDSLYEQLKKLREE